MTEKQGGSDVRANLTTRPPAQRGRPGRRVRARRPQVVLLGAHVRRRSWFSPRRPAGSPASSCHASCPTARATSSASSGSRTSSATARTPRARWSSRGPWAQMVGEEGRGVPTIIEMVGHTRLDCVIGASAGMRQGVAQATWHAAHRSAFGRTLIDQPLMTNVLADLCARVRGRDRHGDAPRPRLRRGLRRPARGRALQTRRDRRREVLDVQARAGPRGRGARMPRRQRLRRGVGDAAPLPREPAGLDLGGLGERPVPRRPARPVARARRRSRRSSARSARRAGADPRLDAAIERARGRVRRPRAGRDALAADRRAHGVDPAGLAARAASATRPSPTPSARRAWPATAGSPTARCRPAPTPRRSSSATARRPDPRPRGPARPDPRAVRRLTHVRRHRLDQALPGSSGSASAWMPPGSSSSSCSSSCCRGRSERARHLRRASPTPPRSAASCSSSSR